MCVYIYIYTRAEAPLKVAEKGGEGGAAGARENGVRREGVAKLGLWAVGWGCGLWAGARRANVALICSVNIRERDAVVPPYPALASEKKYRFLIKFSHFVFY